MKMKFGRVESVFKKDMSSDMSNKDEYDDVKHHNNLMNDGQQRKAYSA